MGAPHIRDLFFGQNQVKLVKIFRGNVRKKGGTPHIRNSFLAENFVRKGGGTPLTDKIRKVVFDFAP